MKTKAIIFDKDGTLIDFDAFWIAVSVAAIKDILKAAKKEEIPFSDILSVVGVNDGITDINGILCKGTYEQMGKAIHAVLSKNGCRLSENEVIRLTIDAYHQNSDNGEVRAACPEISEVFSKLKQMGIKLAVVTTDDSVVTKKCLSALNIEEFFDEIYTDDGLYPAKPDPYCIFDFCKKYDIDKSEIIMVGDTLTDMSFAANGGIKAVGVAKNQANREFLKKSTDCVLPDISYIFDVIE